MDIAVIQKVVVVKCGTIPDPGVTFVDKGGWRENLPSRWLVHTDTMSIYKI